MQPRTPLSELYPIAKALFEEQNRYGGYVSKLFRGISMEAYQGITIPQIILNWRCREQFLQRVELNKLKDYLSKKRKNNPERMHPKFQEFVEIEKGLEKKVEMLMPNTTINKKATKHTTDITFMNKEDSEITRVSDIAEGGFFQSKATGGIYLKLSNQSETDVNSSSVIRLIGNKVVVFRGIESIHNDSNVYPIKKLEITFQL